MADLLRSAVSKKATLALDLSGELPPILGDRSQMRQVILNLVTNASEALGDDAGSVIVRTRVLAPSGAIGEHALPRVSLEVQDTGAGMTAATRARAFEPFFTTKFEGRGLGLATVLSIVQRHGGVIDAGDGPGSGTLIAITLPAAPGGAPAPVEAARAPQAWTASGRALLVDDEAQVRAVVRQMLTVLGFEVVEAADGAEAIQIVSGDHGEFVVAVLDMTMPRMGGAETLAALRPLRPALPVVLVSGYSADEDGGTPADPLTTFLHKPFRLPVLAARIRKVMAAGEARRDA
jgi:CheY-like chemotaxis protein